MLWDIGYKKDEILKENKKKTEDVLQNMRRKLSKIFDDELLSDPDKVIYFNEVYNKDMGKDDYCRLIQKEMIERDLVIKIFI